MRLIYALIISLLLGCYHETQAQENLFRGPNTHVIELGEWLLAFNKVSKAEPYAELPISVSIQEDVTTASPFYMLSNRTQCKLVFNLPFLHEEDANIPQDKMGKEAIMRALMVHEITHCYQSVSGKIVISGRTGEEKVRLLELGELHADIAALSYTAKNNPLLLKMVGKFFLNMRKEVFNSNEEAQKPYRKLYQALKTINTQNLDLITGDTAFDVADRLVDDKTVKLALQ